MDLERQHSYLEATGIAPLFHIAHRMAPDPDAFLLDERTLRAAFSYFPPGRSAGLYQRHGAAVDAFLGAHPEVLRSDAGVVAHIILRYADGFAGLPRSPKAELILIALRLCGRVKPERHFAEFVRPIAFCDSPAERRMLLPAITVRFPHPHIMRLLKRPEETTRVDDSVGRTLLAQLCGLLPAAADAVLARPSQCVALELLEAIGALADALAIAERLEPVEAFLQTVLPASAPFNPHVCASLRVVARRGCDADLLFACLRPPAGAVNPAFADLCSVLRDRDFPEAVAARFLDEIAFAPPRGFTAVHAEVRDLTRALASRHRSLALARLDAALENRSPINLAMAVAVLDATGEKRPIARLVPGYFTLEFLVFAHVTADILRVNVGSADLRPFVLQIGSRTCAHATRRAMWAAIAECRPPAQVVVEAGTLAGALEARARYIRDAGPLGIPHARLQMAIASYKALGVLFDVVAAEEGRFFTSAGVAQLIISQSCGIKKYDCVPIASRDPDEFLELMAYARPKRRLIVGPLLRYLRCVMPGIGRAKILEWLEGHIVPIERRLMFVNAVLEDPKDGGLRPDELDPLFDEFMLIEEVRPNCRLELIKEFVERFSDDDIGGRIGYGRREELIAAARRCLEGVG
jgi:hypothetical protein